jgi:Skp family chaperone for outer membrane proteins
MTFTFAIGRTGLITGLATGLWAITALASTALVSGAAAQQPASQPQNAGAGAAGLGGPLVPGVCLLSREAILANSKVSLYASERIRQLTAEAQAEVDAERKPIDAQIATLRGQVAKMTPDQIRAQEKALGERLAPIQAKADLRRREIEKTRTDALATISAQTQPMIAAAYAQKGCGLLFDRGTVLGGNYGNDITAAVVAALDAKVTSIPIQRATLPPVAPPAR